MMQNHVTSAKVLMKWLGDYNIEILDPWTGLSSDFYPNENLWSIFKRHKQRYSTRILIDFEH